MEHLKFINCCDTPNNVRLTGKTVTRTGPGNLTPHRHASELVSRVTRFRVRVRLPCLFSDWSPLSANQGNELLPNTDETELLQPPSFMQLVFSFISWACGTNYKETVFCMETSMHDRFAKCIFSLILL